MYSTSSFTLTNYSSCGCCLGLPKAKCFSFLSNHRVNVTDFKVSTLKFKTINIKHTLGFNFTDPLDNKRCGLYFISINIYSGTSSLAWVLILDYVWVSSCSFQPQNKNNTKMTKCWNHFEPVTTKCRLQTRYKMQTKTKYYCFCVISNNML